MAPNYNGIALKTALDLALKAREQPKGYTEPLLHAYRIKQKQHTNEIKHVGTQPFFRP